MTEREIGRGRTRQKPGGKPIGDHEEWVAGHISVQQPGESAVAVSLAGSPTEMTKQRVSGDWRSEGGERPQRELERLHAVNGSSVSNRA
jgi:hypothetical protein